MLLGIFGAHHFDAAVVTAYFAYAMGTLDGTAMVAQSHGGSLQLPMGATLVTAGSRSLSFWYSHFSLLI